MSPGASGEWSSNYDASGRWTGEGREPFDLWWQRVQAQARALGVKDDDMDEGAKYAVEIPGVSDIIHIVPRAKITADEMKAHRAALRRKEPSPLSPRQLDTLEWKRKTFLKIMASPTPPSVRDTGWYLNQIENVGDMMTAAAWGGKGVLWTLGKMGLKSKGAAAKWMGWALLAKDIADIINLFRISRTMAKGGPGLPFPKSARQAAFFGSARGKVKKDALARGSLNPFSTEAKLSRGFKVKARLPGIPDWLEILQVTDQFFGVGISFGGIVGFATDALYGIRRGATWKSPLSPVKELPELCLDGFSGGCNLQLGP